MAYQKIHMAKGEYRTAIVRYNFELMEYFVSVYDENMKVLAAATYHTDDEEDAIAAAETISKMGR